MACPMPSLLQCQTGDDHLTRAGAYAKLVRSAVWNERTGNDGSYGEGVAELTAEDVTRDMDLRGKICIVTGASGGIGQEISRVVALRGARVIMACRNLKKAEAARSAIPTKCMLGSLEVMELDLADLASVKTFATAFLALGVPLHFLVHNAAQLNTEFASSKQGFEMDFAVNSLALFYLTNLLLPRLKESKPSRIVGVTSSTLTSIGKERFLATEQPLDEQTFYLQGYLPLPAPLDFNSVGAYALSKLNATILIAELRRRLVGTGVEAASAHPGVIPTELTRQSGFTKFVFHQLPPYSDTVGATRCIKSVGQGASTPVFALVGDVSSSVYYADNAPHDNVPVKVDSSVYLDEQIGKQTWALHERVLASAGFETQW